ncbi:hypothetical protein PHJA_000360600 [Phtheirospermum japonicum]|uniref:Uncharacterized protein n=1 Tax=Phtheirospermum japonicum TaxID=374723 RepID=A0A830BCR7_9LAMI|nr:hypothetical protein PHJA_000360600 [Phtheirospermum japonicum]
MCRVWQFNGNGHTPEYLSSGIADYTRLKAKLVPSGWVKPGGGEHWDDGKDVTARFLEYCVDLQKEFISDLNKKMMTRYNEKFFAEILGKNVGDIWNEYKANRTLHK